MNRARIALATILAALALVLICGILGALLEDPASPPDPVPTVEPTDPTTAPPATAEPTDEPTDPPLDEPAGTYYRSCADAHADGAAPLHRGDPGYRRGLDRDGDGTACDQ